MESPNAGENTPWWWNDEQTESKMLQTNTESTHQLGMDTLTDGACPGGDRTLWTWVGLLHKSYEWTMTNHALRRLHTETLGRRGQFQQQLDGNWCWNRLFLWSQLPKFLAIKMGKGISNGVIGPWDVLRRKWKAVTGSRQEQRAQEFHEGRSPRSPGVQPVDHSLIVRMEQNMLSVPPHIWAATTRGKSSL